jgi:hypothetical protein
VVPAEIEAFPISEPVRLLLSGEVLQRDADATARDRLTNQQVHRSLLEAGGIVDHDDIAWCPSPPLAQYVGRNTHNPDMDARLDAYHLVRIDVGFWHMTSVA